VRQLRHRGNGAFGRITPAHEQASERRAPRPSRGRTGTDFP
jgi:hypothetical protein